MDDATPLRAARVERVLFLQRQPCIRAMKYAVALRERHPAIELGFAYQGKTLTGWNGAGDELFARWWRLPLRGTDEAFERIVNDFAPDVVHSHNLPDVLTVMAARVLGDSTPVVHDIHDLQSLRRTPYEDGFADPQDPIRAEKEAIAAAGLSIDVYPNRDARAYRELAARTPGMTIHDTLAPAELLRRLPAYDVGWAAFNTGLNAAHLDTALPNKAFEYLASGLPVAAGRHKALKGLIREHGVGVVV
ncbi:MAG: glycosyltransferase, partial [Miltoncostaeaceae bacterium]